MNAPMDIERRSFEIIESELEFPLEETIKPIVMRVIHATADFTFARSLHFSPGVAAHMRALMGRDATVITDTTMAAAGINKAAAGKLSLKLHCFMADPDVAKEATARGVTRALVSMERALALPGPKLLVCGNAPTFLLGLLDAAPIPSPDDIAVIGVPVGFVNVVESKQRLIDSGLPCIASVGRRGGSNVAAAILNALMYGIEGIR